MLKFKTFKGSLLFGFILATLLPLILLGYFSYSYLSYTIEESGVTKNELLAAKVAVEISSYLQEPINALRQVSLLLKLGSRTAAEINTYLNLTVSESYLVETIFLINKDKHITHIGLAEEYQHLQENYIGLDLSGLGILKNVEFLHSPVWTRTLNSPISWEKNVALIVPSGQGNYLVGLINIEYFHDIISSHTIESDLQAIILDDSGKPVFHSDLKKVEQQQSFADIEPFLEAQLGVLGTFPFTHNDVEYIGSTANVLATKWLVLVVQPLNIAMRPLENMNRLFFLALIVSITIVVSFALRQSARLLRPLRNFQDNIQAVADGDYRHSLFKQPHEEFEQVAIHFRDMAAAIKRREQLLEINEERLVSLLELHNTKKLNENELLEFALEQAVKLTRSEIGYLHLIDSENTTARTLWSSGGEAFCRINHLTVADLTNMNLWQTSIATLANSIKNVPDTVADHKENRNQTFLRQLSVPILEDSKIVAVAGTVNKQSDYDLTDAMQLSLYISHTLDIIRQKRSDRERLRLSEQLAHAQKLEAIGTLAGGIAHDFNNVLMVILGNTEMARDHIDKPEEIKRDLNEIFHGALRARDLVNQILVFSRNNTEGLKPLDIRPLVKEAVKLLRSSIPTNIEIRQRFADESRRVMAEPGQINQLIMNLSTNAYHAMADSGGILEISLQPINIKTDILKDDTLVVAAGEYMQLSFTDNGKGIPQGNIDRIFEPYFTTREKEQGTGLGLAVVHGILKSLKGAITVESIPGEKTTFTIYLPVIEATGRDQSHVLRILPRGNERIMYVDDDKGVASVNSRLLEGLGYRVTTFTSSKTALEYFHNNKDAFDLVISDMAMPEVTGEELAKKIFDSSPDLPVIICTGFSEKMDKEKAKILGISELMMKPVTKVDLALTVRKVLGFKFNEKIVPD